MHCIIGGHKLSRMRYLVKTANAEKWIGVAMDGIVNIQAWIDRLSDVQTK